MSNPWFRMYHEFSTDPKVQMLSEVDQRRYIMLLCLRCSNGYVTLHETEVSFQLRISNEEYAQTKRVLIEKGLLTEDNRPTAWDKRQYKTDSSTGRVAKHRAKKKQQLGGDGNDCNVTGNGSNESGSVDETKCNRIDTDTDTDTELKKKDKKEKPNPKSKQIYHPPSDIDPVLWAKYLVSRKEKKHPMNAASLEMAANAILKTTESGYAIDQIMMHMIESGWRTVKPDWISNLEQQHGKNNESGSGAGTPAIDFEQPIELDQWNGFKHGGTEGVGNTGGKTIEGNFSHVETSAG